MGVAPADDAKYLSHDYGVALKSTLDIRHLAKQSEFEAGGLATLSSSLLGAVLDKSWRVSIKKYSILASICVDVGNYPSGTY